MPKLREAIYNDGLAAVGRQPAPDLRSEALAEIMSPISEARPNYRVQRSAHNGLVPLLSGRSCAPADAGRSALRVMNNHTQIYVAVLDHPGGCWQPVRATAQPCGCFRILDKSDDPEHDVWEYTEGDSVQCEALEFHEGEVGLVARRKCACPRELSTS